MEIEEDNDKNSTKNQVSLLRIRKTLKKTKNSNVLCIVQVIFIISNQEHYLRDDIPCNAELCNLCKQNALLSNLSKNPLNNTYFIPDVETIIKQIDLLERNDEKLTNFIIIQSGIYIVSYSP